MRRQCLPRYKQCQQLRSLAVLSVAWLCLASGLAPALTAQKPHVHRHPVKKLERKQVEDLAEQWRKAQLAGDTVAMDKLLSDDYLGVPASGALLTKAQQLDRMSNRKWTVTKLDVTDMKVKLIGKVAIVTSLAQIEADTDNGPVNGEFRYTQIYQQLPSGTWKITHSDATRVAAGGRPKEQ